MEKSDFFTYLRFCVCEEKSLYNRNVGPNKPVEVLYEQKLVYQNPVKSQNYIIYSGPTKLVKVHTAIRTKSSLVRPVKNLNCLNDIKTIFLRPFKLFIFYKKILHALKTLKA